jgi:hypothetical protein
MVRSKQLIVASDEPATFVQRWDANTKPFQDFGLRYPKDNTLP